MQTSQGVIAVAGLCLASVVHAGVVYERPCRTEVEVIPYFSVESYLGKWYEMQRYESIFEPNLDCVQVAYSLQDEDTVTVNNSGFNLETEEPLNALGTAVVSFPDDEVLLGKLNVSFFGAPNDRSNYWILDTDYNSYSVVWACEPLDDDTRSEESFWLLSRTPTFPTDPDVLFRVNYLMRRYIDRSEIRFTEQVNESCPVF